ncbi:serine/threonine-protein kinase [Acanthopleuribacter pedis]|uniref:Protein kinase n=1 Tax=Acanthopleuribacter pedis TaxID=442870 RepID=A0A8J7QHP6_9BACT|nr:serine/threonine-protein kinase [Acanthopleuribacter pedis]MBO1320435.1 protein kinase [Acanthopleuribacter pedis]
MTDSLPMRSTSETSSTSEDALFPRRTSQRRSADDGLIGRRLGRYRIHELVGRGGLGSVYKAYDEKLRRHVALKVLDKIEGDDWHARVLEEAQAQARVEHQHICKVFDVSQLDERTCIAMQFIKGRTLIDAAHFMKMDEKVKVLQQVSEAVHTAHRLGMVHRDLKPSNIMVEIDAQGEHKPYVLDFGLARDLNPYRANTPGSINGSPHYMSPEQASGAGSQFSRQSDVYSLGATLYHVLCGEPPIKGESRNEIIQRAQVEVPVAPRKRNPDIPMDLNVIVMKCLEKDPDRRYDSALSLANDLQRYLNRDPIMALSPSFSYYLKKMIAKHRALFSVTVVAMTMLLFIGGLSMHVQYKNRERARLLQRFVAQVESMEWFLRVAKMMPRQDIRPQKHRVREQIAKIEGDMSEIGRLGAGPGYYAIGRGYLLLEEYEKARTNLERAVDHDFGSPEVYRALAETLGALYDRALRDIQHTSDRQLKKAEEERIQREFRDPAVEAFKRSSEGWLDGANYLEATLAYYEEDFDLARGKARAAFRDDPWFYEARLLEAKIFMALAEKARDDGNYHHAEDTLKEASHAIGEVQRIAPSDISAYLLEMDRLRVLFFQDTRTGREADTAHDRFKVVSEQALEIDPADLHVIAKKAQMLFHWGEYVWFYQGGNPQKEIDTARELLEPVMEKHGDFAPFHKARSHVYMLQAGFEVERGINPSVSFDKAIASLQRLLELNPSDMLSYNTLGLVYWNRADYLYQTGKDPSNDLSEARFHFHQLKNEREDLAVTYNSLGLVNWTQAEYLRFNHQDPLPYYDKAIGSFEQAIQRNQMEFAYSNLAAVANTKADYLRRAGKDPTDALAVTRNTVEAGLTINTDDPDLHYERGRSWLITAQHVMDRGESPLEAFAAAKEALEKVLTISGDWYGSHLEMGEYYLIQACWAHGREDQSASEEMWRKALDYVEKAVAINPLTNRGKGLMGQIWLLAARQAATEAEKQVRLKRAVDHFEACFARLNPENELFRGDYERAKELLSP